VHRASYGAIGHTGDTPGVPFFKRYFLGGSENLRGWGRLEVSPLSETGTPLGGQAHLWASSEARVPIVGPVGAAAFLDAGNAWRQPWTLRPNDLRYSAGVGLRYRSPFGPLRLDVGYQLNPIHALRIGGEPQERRWRVHAGAGQGF
jgi:outer membrane translocation and assembly module TamA